MHGLFPLRYSLYALLFSFDYTIEGERTRDARLAWMWASELLFSFLRMPNDIEKKKKNNEHKATK